MLLNCIYKAAPSRLVVSRLEYLDLNIKILRIKTGQIFKLNFLDWEQAKSTMKQLSDWGLNAESWKGSRGEYWVVAQAGLMLGFLVLPVYRPIGLLPAALPVSALPVSALYGLWATAALLLLGSVVLVSKGLLALGQSLTPLPYPRADGQLVQTGSYALVRHPLYSGVTLAALAYAVGQFSLSHLAGALLLLVFFDRKASREETWLREKYLNYGDYQQRVKKLIPWLY